MGSILNEEKMNYKFLIIKRSGWIILLILASLSLAFSFREGEGGKKIRKQNLLAGDSYRMVVNNIIMPMNKEGVLANVAIGGNPEGGRLAENGGNFLFSGGFYMSGVTNGTMWSNGVASASRIQDYQPGTYESGRSDSRAQLYVLKASDGDFASSWDEWSDAVALGAYFHDGNGNGVYDPVDANGNGKWDPDEDRPDLIGDETVWCVYSDQIDPALRRFNDVDPQGIEIGQTVFAFASKGVTGNMIFVRYSILNTGAVADVIDDVYFSVWADVDIGEENDAYLDDLVGCDPEFNRGFTYNDGDDSDPNWGVNPPCFMIDFFQGPVSYVPGETFIDANGNDLFDEGEETLDTAYNVQGQARGIAVLPGAKNIGLSSFSQYFQSDPVELSDPNNRHEARNYLLGVDKFGNSLDPCTWSFGNVLGGVNCADVDNRYWYSGDPVTQTGWIQNLSNDQRQMSNTGPFKLIAGQPVDIVAAYVVGRGTNQLNSITVAREYDETAQLLFDNNFPGLPAPPSIVYEVKTGTDFIDITWETADQIIYSQAGLGIDTVLDVNRRLEGYYITTYRTASKAGIVSGINNDELLATYDLDNFIDNIYAIAPNGGQDLVQEVGTKLDTLLYGDPETGRINLRIRNDPFTGGPLIKGHEYYFAITHYYLNHNIIFLRDSINEHGTEVYGPEHPGDYYDPLGSALEEFETPLITVPFGKDLYSPADRGPYAELDGATDGEIRYLVVDSDQLTGDEYQVEFFNDNSQAAGEIYTPFWKLTNTTTGTLLIDSSKVFNFDTTSYAGRVIDGFILKVKPVEAEIGIDDADIEYSGDKWFTQFRSDSSTGVYYVGQDIPQARAIIIGNNSGSGSARSSIISADRLRRVELRFQENSGKAYRYLNGYVGGPFTAARNFVYAEGVSENDTGIVGTQDRGVVGKFGEGFVDVPFTAWVVDENFDEERQLAVGFIEYSKNLGGSADGIWDPGVLDTLLKGNEVIVIFDGDYDPNGGQIQYTGNSNEWADIIKGYELDATGSTPEQVEIAASSWFDALYVVSLKRNSKNSFYNNGDVFTIPVLTYPYTENDTFTFKTRVNGELTADEEKALFDKINVFPNPLFGFNPATSYSNTAPDETFVTFSNLPEEITIKIYTLSGVLIRTLTTSDKSGPTSPFLRWDLKNEDGLRAASGLYLALVDAPGFGEKILKFSIIMPQKQINRF
jgi:hypothetical protein